MGCDEYMTSNRWAHFNGAAAPSQLTVPEGEKVGVFDPEILEPTLVIFSDAKDDLDEEICRELSSDGIKFRRLLTTDENVSQVISKKTLILSLTTSDTGSSQHHSTASQLAIANEAYWLAVTRIQSRFMLITEVLSKESKPCYACIQACTNFWLQKKPVSKESLMPSNPIKLAFLSALISESLFDAFASLGVTTDKSSGSTALLSDNHTFTSEVIIVGRIPGCPNCWPSSDQHPRHGDLQACNSALLEECSRTRIRVPVGKNAVPLDALSLTAPAAQQRWYPNSLQIALPSCCFHFERTKEATSVSSLENLSSLLFLTFGRWNESRAQRPDRVLPSAGNLQSPEAFLIVRDVDGLEPGAYFYMEQSHSVAKIESASFSDCQNLIFDHLIGQSLSGPDALIVIAGSYARIRAKYGPFGYRLVHFDCGFFVEHLRMVSSSLSLSLDEVWNVPIDTLETVLALNEEECPIMATLALSFGGSSTSLTFEATGEPPLQKYNPEISLDFSLSNANLLVKEIQDASRNHYLRKTTVQQNSFLFQLANETQHPSPPKTTQVELWHRLLFRRSVRDFDDSPISLAVAAAILERVRFINEIGEKIRPIKIFATLKTGKASPVSWRTFDLSNIGASLQSGSLSNEALATIFVDSTQSDAPLIFWFCGDVRNSPSGYRQMLFEAGRQAYLIWQESLGFSLEGTVIGGIWPSKVASVLGIRYCDQSPLLAYICGIPKNRHLGE